MNALENIGLLRLEAELREAMDRLHEKNEGRQEHLRIHTLANMKRAFDILKALQDNHADKTK